MSEQTHIVVGAHPITTENLYLNHSGFMHRFQGCNLTKLDNRFNNRTAESAWVTTFLLSTPTTQSVSNVVVSADQQWKCHYHSILSKS